MATGIEIVGLISGTITIVDTIIKAYEAIKDLRGLPEAFQQVNDRLPLLKNTLADAREQAENADSTDDPAALKDLLVSCEKKAKELRDIFLAIVKNSTSGEPVIAVYRSIVLKLGKKSRVEALMNDILKDLGVLAAHSMFRAATHKRVEEVEKAREELEKVLPSVPDSAFDEGGGGSYTAGRDMFNYIASGSATLKRVEGNNYETQGNQGSIYYGTAPPERSDGKRE